MERRKALTLLVQAGSGLLALVVGVPTLMFAFAPAARRRSQEQQWRSLGPIDRYPVGQIKQGVIEPSPASEAAQTVPQGVYVWRKSEEEVVVFSRSCTDLGCPVTFDPGSQCFLCPCHGGIFDSEGRRLAGPPDRPLYRYENRIHDGHLQVDLLSVPPMA